MRPRTLAPALLTIAALAIARPAPAQQTLYAIGDGGSSLVRFRSDDPGSIAVVGSFGANLFLDSIDFRPSTGQLYGYSDLADAYYTVDLDTAALTPVSAPNVGAATNTFFLGMDWNPTVDRLRVVTDSTQNIVFNPNTGTAMATTPLFYGTGDANEGVVPLVIENAYTNSVAGAATTQQYALDYGLNTLVTLANSAGTLGTVGEVTLGGSVLDFDEFAGFDIFSSNGSNIAYALLTVDGTPGLYTLDLGTGAATFLGEVEAGFGPVYGLTAVPEPSGLVLCALGASAVAGIEVRRRRRRARTS